MADSADLVVLGAWYGHGSKGGLLTVFLMGCQDPATGRWKTVCKTGNGFDDATIERLQPELSPLFTRIRESHDLLPTWLDCDRIHTPEFVVADPKLSPVWEIEGAEFTDSTHSTSGIAIRFPRVIRIRDDKDWTNHTNTIELRALKDASAPTIGATGSELDGMGAAGDGGGGGGGGGGRKRKHSDDGGDDGAGAGAGGAGGGVKRAKRGEFETEVLVEAPPGFVTAVTGDVTRPMSPHANACRIILLPIDNSGVWGRRGLYRAVAARSNQPKRLYESSAKRNLNNRLGDVQLSCISNANGGVYVACVICHDKSEAEPGAAPPFSIAHFRAGLTKLARIALSHEASVHMASPVPPFFFFFFPLFCRLYFVLALFLPK